MRANIFNRTGLGKTVFVEYEITGLNLTRLLNAYKRAGINLYDVKKYQNKRIRVSVKHCDRKKLFAISKEMCYNIRKVREKGRGYPLLYLWRNVGLVFGFIFFAVSAFVVSDYVFAVDYSGSGSVYKRQVGGYLSERGIGVYSRFSDIDLSSLGDEILSVSPNLSFAECRKQGNRLKIELVLSKTPPKPLTGTATELTADADGVIEELKVYRGTAEVKVGDAVKKGQVLVGGYYTVGEEKVFQNVIAGATLRVEKTYLYYSEKDNQENLALLFAEQELGILQPADFSVLKTQTENGYEYLVTLVNKRVLFIG